MGKEAYLKDPASTFAFEHLPFRASQKGSAYAQTWRVRHQRQCHLHQHRT
ncbi:uncharacterized protein METZ01_LOCUS131393 [marine metagenome]|uniref:Uncharacterized protein n=1 Tax=marine metagenome TaxID=408172 RepID=A0A381YNK4_9ZZZZ